MFNEGIYNWKEKRIDSADFDFQQTDRGRWQPTQVMRILSRQKAAERSVHP